MGPRLAILLRGTDRTRPTLAENCLWYLPWTHFSNAIWQQLRSTRGWLSRRTIRRLLTNTRNWHVNSAILPFRPSSMTRNLSGSEQRKALPANAAIDDELVFRSPLTQDLRHLRPANPTGVP